MEKYKIVEMGRNWSTGDVYDCHSDAKSDLQLLRHEQFADPNDIGYFSKEVVPFRWCWSWSDDFGKNIWQRRQRWGGKAAGDAGSGPGGNPTA